LAIHRRRDATYSDDVIGFDDIMLIALFFIITISALRSIDFNKTGFIVARIVSGCDGTVSAG
jgi:hypothetical protein